jgi:hypothetical protein
MPSPQQHFEAARQWQAYFDEHCREVGMRAPEPILGQTVNDYRREVDRLIKRTFLPQNHDLYKINYRGLKADALDAIEPQLLAAAKIEAFNPQNVPRGTLKEIVTRDPGNGQEVHKFVGQESFVKLPNFGTNMRMHGGYREGRRAHIWDPRGNSWFPYPPQSRKVA